MKAPKFSVITPTFNRCYVLWKAIQLIQNQSFSNWEHLIVDDGSTDATKKLMAEFQEDERIKYFYQENQGPSSARNLGLQQARGEIIVYLDSDDEPYPHFLATIQQALIQRPEKKYGICNHNRTHEFLDEDFKTKAAKFDPDVQSKETTLEDFYQWKIKTTSTGVFHKRDFVEGRAAWREGLFIEDLEFMMQLAVLDEQAFLHIPQTLFRYRQKYGGDGLCSLATYATWAHSFGQIYALHKNDPLMRDPSVFLNRVEKYTDLHKQTQSAQHPAQHFKYFPELHPTKS